MSTPLVHQYLGAKAYRDLPDNERSQDIEFFYATNRPASGSESERIYENGIVGRLQLGTVTVQLGEPGMSWKEMLRLSTKKEREGEVPLYLKETRELDSLPVSDGSEFARRMNRELSEQLRPEITIYVHGAKSTFYRSTTQAAQFYHFMGRQTAMIAYSWPSTGRFLTYNQDVKYANESAGNLADLIEYLAANTSARKINLLFYSAGGQVGGPGLALLRERYPQVSDSALGNRFRIGEVYFAAADVSQEKFLDEYLPAFDGIVDRITVTHHIEDGVLKFAQKSHHGVARLGRPDVSRITADQIKQLEALAGIGKLDSIDMNFTTSERPIEFNVHGHWYANEWVSSDAILQLLLHESPARRGLERKPNSKAWYFPPEYPDRLQRLVDAAE